MQSVKLRISKPRRTRSKLENLRRNINNYGVSGQGDRSRSSCSEALQCGCMQHGTSNVAQIQIQKNETEDRRSKRSIGVGSKKSAGKKERRIQSYGGVAVLLHATATWTQQCCTKSKSRKAKSKTGKIKKSIDVAFQALIIKNEESYRAVQMRFSYVARNLQSTVLHLTEPGRGERRLKKMKNHHDISRSLRSKGQI